MLALIKRKLQTNQISFKVAILICIFATGSWIEINGIWVELPILVANSPQQWSLPSYLSVAIQLANIGPLAYILCRRYLKYNSKPIINEQSAIYIVLSVGVVASFILAFTWDMTTSIAGTLYSTPLITLNFFLALVDCTSSVTFLPFMANFHVRYMTVFYIGEGLSGLLPSIVALIQGVGKQSYRCTEEIVTVNSTRMQPKNVTEIQVEYFETHPLFSAQVFFFVIFALMCSSLSAYCWLVRIVNKNNGDESSSIMMENVNDSNDVIENRITDDNTKNNNELNLSESSISTMVIQPKTSKKTIIYLLVINALINALSNGVLPSLQSYACLPYGNTIYHLTLTLSAFVNPLSCFLYFFISTESVIKITMGVVVYVISASFMILTAAASPCPYLVNDESGGILILIVTVFGVAIVNYFKTAISTILRRHGYKALLWNGISEQVGSLVGACIIFPLVNVYMLFAQSVPCQKCPY